jgi:sugar-specific transcriptional regulator TrmB
MSKNLDQEGIKKLVKRLEQFGLSEKEAQVYFALLPRRDTGSSKLVVATGLHKQFVYNALERLEELGLAKHVIERGRKKFSANPPKRLLVMAEEKKLFAQSISRELEGWYTGAHEQDFEVYQGDDAFVAHQLELLRNSPDGSFLDVILSPHDRFSATHKALGLWDEYQRIWKEKNIAVRILASEKQREWMEWRKKNEPNFDYRILPGVQNSKINTDIRLGSVTFMVNGETLLDFTLIGKEIADGYREHFEAVWALAKQ